MSTNPPKSKQIVDEAKRIEEDSLYSSKGHFYAGQCWSGVGLWLGCITAVLSAVAGTSALSKFDHSTTVAGSLAILVAVVTAIITFTNPNEKATLHKEAGNKYNSLKNDVRIFYEIEASINEKEAIRKLKELNGRRNQLNQESVQIPKWAFEKARVGIEDEEAEYQIDNQINDEKKNKAPIIKTPGKSVKKV